MKHKAVFVDRDGTINRDVNYLDDPERFQMYPTVGEGIRRLNEAGFLVVVITNQSGLARGLFTRQTLDAIHERMRRELARSGASLDALYFCPHHPDEGCSCRKPGTALLERAVREYEIDPGRSFFVGDRMMDVQAGQGMGCRTVLIPEQKERVEEEKASSTVQADFECSQFLDGVIWILQQDQKAPVSE